MKHTIGTATRIKNSKIEWFLYRGTSEMQKKELLEWIGKTHSNPAHLLFADSRFANLNENDIIIRNKYGIYSMMNGITFNNTYKVDKIN